MSGILAGHGFNIDSLVVYRTEIRDLGGMCIVISGQDRVVEQARWQLEEFVPVYAALDITGNAHDPTQAAPRRSICSRAQ